MHAYPQGWRLLDAFGEPVFAADRHGRIVYWNHPAELRYGWPAGEAIGRPLTDVTLPDLADPAARAMLAAVTDGRAWSGDLVLQHREGTTFPGLLRLSPVRDTGGDVVGVVGVTTDLTERLAAERVLRESQEHRRLALEAGRMGTWSLDVSSGVVLWDDALEELFGVPPGGFAGTLDDWAAHIHPDDRAAVLDDVQTAVAEGKDFHVEHRVVSADGSTRWLDARGIAQRGADLAVTGMIGVAHDITDRKQAEELLSALLDRERAVTERLTFLASASDALSTSLDRQMTLAILAQIPVPSLADWCAVHLIGPGNDIVLEAVWHDDPGASGRLREVLERYPPKLHDPIGPGAAVFSGESQLVRDVSPGVIETLAADPGQRAAYATLPLGSLVVVPLTARGRTFGALTLAREEAGRYDDTDIPLAEDLARRAALAIDNSRMYADRVRVAEALQRALVPPELPAIPGIEVASFYRTAGEAEVGGDFYDAFRVSEDRWGVVVGDVCGKGAPAAALTGVARTTVRLLGGQGWELTRVLQALNDTILEQAEEGHFCTVAAVLIQPWETGAEVTACVAGHPLPMIRRADGRVETLGLPGTLLGIVPTPDLREQTTHLGSGDVLVFYTDGVTERTAAGRMFGEEGLRALLADVEGLSALEIAASIEHAVVDFDDQPPRDDLAGVVLRVR